MRLLRLTVSTLAAAVLAAGCSDGGSTAPAGDPAFGAVAPRGQLALYGVGAMGVGCTAPAHREFDFWVGKWDVENPSAARVGTNAILSGLDGCAVLEHWTGAGGGRGRSLNMYDAADGQWHQRWVDEFTTHLRLDGGLVNGNMVMSGVRNFPTISVVDRITWTPIAPDSVRQFWDISLDSGTTFALIAFDGLYLKRPEIAPAPAPGTAFCAGAPFDEFDFWVGEWEVEVGAPGRGRSVVTNQLSGCLVEESFQTADGYESVTWVSYDALESRWFRYSIDSEGQRLELSGVAQGDAIVLTGEDRLRTGQTGLVRATWERRGPNLVRQLFETSLDGGASWKVDLRTIYHRK
jgi:hypothetical protein